MSKIVVKTEPKSPSTATKKPQVPQLSDSDSEVEIVGPVAKNFKKPRPGSPAFELQAPVTITTTQGPSSGPGRRLSFGAADVEVENPDPFDKPASSKRLRKPSRRKLEADAAQAFELSEAQTRGADVRAVVRSNAPLMSPSRRSSPAVPGASPAHGRASATVAVTSTTEALSAVVTAAGKPSGSHLDQLTSAEGLRSGTVAGTRHRGTKEPLTINGRSFSEEARMLTDDEEFPALPSAGERDSQLSEYSLLRRSRLRSDKSVRAKVSSRQAALVSGFSDDDAASDGFVVVPDATKSSFRGPDDRRARDAQPTTPRKSTLDEQRRGRSPTRHHDSSRPNRASSRPKAPKPSGNKGKERARSPSQDGSMGSLCDFIVNDSDVESDVESESPPPRKSAGSRPNKRPHLSTDDDDSDHPKLDRTRHSKSSKRSARKKPKMSSDHEDDSESSDGSLSSDGQNSSRSPRKKHSRGHRKLSARKKNKKSARRLEDSSSDDSASTDFSSASSGSAVDEDSDSDDVFANRSSRKRKSGSSPRKSSSKRKGKKKSKSETSGSDNSDLSASADDSATSGTPVEKRRKDKYRKDKSKKKDKKHNGPSRDTARSKGDAAPSTSSASQRRKLPSTPQLDELHKRFPDLPRLHRFAELFPFRRLQEALESAGRTNDNFLKFAKTFHAMRSDHSARLLRRCQLFTHGGIFANPRSVDPDLFIVSGSCAVWKENRANVVWLTPGAVAECNIVIPALHGAPPGYLTKKITVFPFIENHDCTMSLFGSVCNFDAVKGFFADGALCFSTKKQGAAGNNSSYHGITSPSPKKPKFFAQASSSTPRPKPRTHYPQVLSFDEGVPIYDARDKSLKFDAEGLANLSTLPLLKEDLSPYSIVAVGYTFNIYNMSEGLASSFNLMFVILLGDGSDRR